MKLSKNRPFERVAARVVAACVVGGSAFGLVAGTTGYAGASSSPQTAQAQKYLLVLHDMPKGWTASKTGKINNATPGAAQLAKCIGIPLSVVDARPPTAYSKNFNSKDQQLSVQDNVSIYPSAAAARADFDFFKNPRTPACLTKNLNGPGRTQMESETDAGKGLGTVLVSREPAADFAPHTANYVMFFPVVSDGSPTNVQFTQVDFIKGNEEQTVGFTSFNSNFPATLSKELTGVAEKRL